MMSGILVDRYGEDNNVKQLDDTQLESDVGHHQLIATASNAVTEEQSIIDVVNNSLSKPSSSCLNWSPTESIEQAIMEHETRDIVVKIHKPEKVIKAMESFVQYTVSTKPLPEKQSFTLDRFDQEFVRLREVGLNRFTNRICDHPVMSNEKSLYNFLTMETNTFQRYIKETRGVLSRVNVVLSSLSIPTQFYQTTSVQNQKILKYTESFADRMMALEQVTHRLLNEQNAYVKSLDQCSLSYSFWAGNDTHLNNILMSMSQLYDDVSQAYQTMISATSFNVILPLKEYSLYADIIKSRILKTEFMKSKVEQLTNSKLQYECQGHGADNSKPAISATLANENHSTVSASFFRKLSNSRSQDDESNTKIQQLMVECHEAEDQLEIANADFSADLERWHFVKKSDMKQLITGIAVRNINFYDVQIEVLETKIAQLREWRHSYRPT